MSGDCTLAGVRHCSSSVPGCRLVSGRVARYSMCSAYRWPRVTAGAPVKLGECQYWAVSPGPVPLAGVSTEDGTAVRSAVSIIDAAFTGSLPGVNVTWVPDPARAVMPGRVGVPVVGAT